MFCGTAPSRVSAARRAYYASPGNKFWPTLHQVGLTPRRFAPTDFSDLLPLGIGLTDVCKTEAGLDSEITPASFDPAGLAARLAACRPGVVAFTSKKAASLFLRWRDTAGLAYGPMAGPAALPRLFVLPSTSGLACRSWDIAPWYELARLVDAPGAA